MVVSILLPGMLRVLANGQERVGVTGNTALECLEELDMKDVADVLEGENALG